MTHFVLATAVLLYAAGLGAQAPRSAVITGVHYDVTFRQSNARQGSFDAAMSFDVAGRDDVLLSMPAWTPGAYEISNFARNVVAFDATQGDSAIRWEREDHDTWRVHPASRGRVTVRFTYRADSLDNAGAWAKPDFLLFNGTTAFLYPEGQPFTWPATVTVHTDGGWQVATAMPDYREAGGGRRGTRPGRGDRYTFAEDNYHDLVDHPFFVGALEMDSAMVAGKWMRLVTYPARSLRPDARRRVWRALQAMTPPQVAVFGDVPWRTYTVMQIADSAYGGASGLEHSDSHVDIIAWRALENPVVLSLYAHEIVHAWNVKRLRPAELVPYRYDAPQPTPMLWVAEGITDYYADLSLVRGGVIDSADFLSTTQGKIENVGTLPATSLEDASLATWVAPRDGTHYVYYDHGSLAGLLLDVLIRDATNNQRSLDDVMRDLYRSTYPRGRGFTNDEWWATVDRIGGTSFAEFRSRYVDGRERLPYSAVLPLAAIRVREDTTRQLRFGVLSIEDTSGVLVIEVQPGSSAADAGVRGGDYLVSIGDVAVTSSEFGARFRERYAGRPEGTRIPVRVRRAGQDVEMPAQLRTVASVSYRLSYDPSAGEKARRIWRGLLTGR